MIEFNRDTKDKCYMYFNDCYVEIKNDSIDTKKYTELKKYVWKTNIINKPFKYIKGKPSVFERFIKLAMNKTEELIDETHILRYNSIKSTIGYLLHRYKDPALTKAVVAVDQKITRTGEPNGRSGKSLLLKAISKVKNVTLIEGQNFNFEKPFAFSTVSLDTEIINFNDVRRNFEFDRLFGLITEEFVYEKKRIDAITIPFDDSPKFYISTNYTLKTEGDSSKGRMQVVEFSDFFNAENTPIEYFKQRFFDEWDNNEWELFYSFMIDCIQTFLKEGLIAFPLQNYNERKLIALPYGQDLLDYIEDEWKIQPKIDYDEHHHLQDFLKRYPRHEKLTIQGFTKFLREYAALQNWSLNPHTQGKKDTRYKKNGTTYVLFVPNDEAKNYQVDNTETTSISKQTDLKI